MSTPPSPCLGEGQEDVPFIGVCVFCRSLLAPHPNTYTYSKRLAEDLVARSYPDLPACIVRPSIGAQHFVRGKWGRHIHPGYHGCPFDVVQCVLRGRSPSPAGWTT